MGVALAQPLREAFADTDAGSMSKRALGYRRCPIRHHLLSHVVRSRPLIQHDFLRIQFVFVKKEVVVAVVVSAVVVVGLAAPTLVGAAVVAIAVGVAGV